MLQAIKTIEYKVFVSSCPPACLAVKHMQWRYLATLYQLIEHKPVPQRQTAITHDHVSLELKLSLSCKRQLRLTQLSNC
jgi:hypothetical protein